MDAETIKAWTELFTAVNAARWWVLAALFALIVVGAYVTVWYLKFRRAERRELETAKAKRGQAYADALNDLHETLRELKTSVTDNTSKVTQAHRMSDGIVEKLSESVSRMGQRLSALGHKVDGKLSRQDSCRLIHHAFEHDLYREVCMVLERSLAENDFARRSDHIRRKVCTAIADALIEARQYLASYPLSVDCNAYFTIDDSAPGERFLLVDKLWAAVEPKYDHQSGSLPHRTEEVKLLIENAIKDYIAVCYHRLNVAGYSASNPIKSPIANKPDQDSSDPLLMAMPHALFAGSYTQQASKPAH